MHTVMHGAMRNFYIQGNALLSNRNSKFIPGIKEEGTGQI